MHEGRRKMHQDGIANAVVTYFKRNTNARYFDRSLRRLNAQSKARHWTVTRILPENGVDMPIKEQQRVINKLHA
ncbi:hypothetical protein DPMN_095387 [Dreissena polymorpha]|uniref:Uncharacterized protein n=1 Tax=Dreissena polymorpha TaxID=45954 RepID=A0A9D4L9C6_DREPO|nr:hypothetical protein DPMN_095387 [Dreissena polymorpha]